MCVCLCCVLWVWDTQYGCVYVCGVYINHKDICANDRYIDITL